VDRERQGNGLKTSTWRSRQSHVSLPLAADSESLGEALDGAEAIINALPITIGPTGCWPLSSLIYWISTDPVIASGGPQRKEDKEAVYGNCFCRENVSLDLILHPFRPRRSFELRQMDQLEATALKIIHTLNPLWPMVLSSALLLSGVAVRPGVCSLSMCPTASGQ
jgi:hypothetical protein